MPKLGYVTPWYVLGSALILIGSALMCKISAPEILQSPSLITEQPQSIRGPLHLTFMASPF